jgi:hypothetical protein
VIVVAVAKAVLNRGEDEEVLLGMGAQTIFGGDGVGTAEAVVDLATEEGAEAVGLLQENKEGVFIPRRD